MRLIAFSFLIMINCNGRNKDENNGVILIFTGMKICSFPKRYTESITVNYVRFLIIYVKGNGSKFITVQ